jgi:hypothetical protein
LQGRNKKPSRHREAKKLIKKKIKSYEKRKEKTKKRKLLRQAMPSSGLRQIITSQSSKNNTNSLMVKSQIRSARISECAH